MACTQGKAVFVTVVTVHFAPVNHMVCVLKPSLPVPQCQVIQIPRQTDRFAEGLLNGCCCVYIHQLILQTAELGSWSRL